VSTVLGVHVCRFEDGTADGQVDARVHYPDRLAALEIVTDPDKRFQRQQAERYRESPIAVSGLRDSWMVQLSRRANIPKVKRVLPDLLRDLQDNPPLRRPRCDGMPLVGTFLWRA
jgi:hypothetical protein